MPVRGCTEIKGSRPSGISLLVEDLLLLLPTALLSKIPAPITYCMAYSTGTSCAKFHRGGQTARRPMSRIEESNESKKRTCLRSVHLHPALSLSARSFFLDTAAT